MEKVIKEVSRTCNEAILSLFRVAYYIGKSLIPFARFLELLELLVSEKATMTESLYHDEKSCFDLFFCILSIIQKSVLHRVRDAKFYGIMIDESTDISVTGHLVVFATFVEEGEVASVFLGLLQIADGKKDATLIYETLLTSLKEWGLDVNKCVAFGLDGAATMMGKKIGVATQLKEKVNPFLLSCHCVAHRTNLAALDDAKKRSCEEISKEMDKMIKNVASFF